MVAVERQNAEDVRTGAQNGAPRRVSRLSPMNQRRLRNFKANRRGYWSLWIFLALFFVTLIAEFIANDKPLLLKYNDEFYYPVFVDYPESIFGGFYAKTDYKDPFIQEQIEKAGGWIIWPVIRYSYKSINREAVQAFPSRPTLDNLLGTDDQGRDVMARLIYGFRISVLFGLTLTLISSVIGVAAGAVQGYFGGWTDLLFQRFIEVWSSVPQL